MTARRSDSARPATSCRCPTEAVIEGRYDGSGLITPATIATWSAGLMALWASGAAQFTSSTMACHCAAAGDGSIGFLVVGGSAGTPRIEDFARRTSLGLFRYFVICFGEQVVPINRTGLGEQVGDRLACGLWRVAPRLTRCKDFLVYLTCVRVRPGAPPPSPRSPCWWRWVLRPRRSLSPPRRGRRPRPPSRRDVDPSTSEKVRNDAGAGGDAPKRSEGLRAP
jgi:hypothetical protein